MRYSYKSNGIVSRSIGDYRDSVISDFANFQIWEGAQEFTEGQYQTITIAQTSVAANNYGNIAAYGSEGIGSRTKGSGIGVDTQVASGGILIVGERGPVHFSGEATCFPKYASKTGINCFGSGANRYCVYSYESGNVSETVGQHGSSVINAGIGARRIDSFQFIFDVWQPISRFVGAAECMVYNYEPCVTEEYTELDYGLITVNHTATIDNGNITQLNAVTIEDRGNILDRWKTRFGFKRVIGEAQAKATNAWVGSGRIVSFGRQVSPSVWGWITDGKVKLSGAADVDFSAAIGGGGFTPLSGEATIGITAVFHGDGSLKKFSGSAESATWNPEEKQMLFSFIGGSVEKHVESYVGSGRIKNLAKIEAEKGTFNYVGSGEFKLRPRKPTTYKLSELANFTLEIETPRTQEHESFGDNAYGWNGTTQLGGVLVCDLHEKDHEKFSKVYDQSATVEFVRKDYGFLVQTGLTNCVANSGTISTNTTATSGCIKVAPGTSLAIAPGNTYTIPQIITTPTDFIDYGNVADGHIAAPDYGWILDTSDLRTPYGRGLRFTSQVEVNVNQTFEWTSTGEGYGGTLLRLSGVTALPLDVAEYGDGRLFGYSGSAECVSNVLDGTGLFRFKSLTHVSRARDFVGSGRIPKFSGAAESVTWNPVERQMLFDFTGVAHGSNTDVAIGSGDFSTFSSATESILWSAQHTQGLFRIDGDSYDTRARAFAGSGSLKKFTGTSESVTWNPEEKQMLFSFTGVGAESHTEVYIGSGRIRNLAKLEAERQTFSWSGSGTIKLLPRKPYCYPLSDLATFTLDNYVIPSTYINLGDIYFYDEAVTNLGSVQLTHLVCEEGHEKHTEVYNNSACEDGAELDYGFLVQSGLTNCVANSGTISTNTTATNGCIKVAPTTTLAIAPGVTYTIPNQLTTPTDSEDYGLISDLNAPERRDYGWILGTLSKKCPYGFSDIIGTAKTHFVENIVSTSVSVSGRATLNIGGAAKTFWTPPFIGQGLGRIVGTLHESFTPATAIGSGNLFTYNGSAESTSVVGYGGGLFKIGSQAYTLFSLLHPGSGTIRVLGTVGESFTPTTYIGSGSLKKFSGAAESTTWNPLEKQMLFSFTGTGKEIFAANPPEEGTEIRLSGTAAPYFFIPNYPGYGVVRFTGEGDTTRARDFVGSGSLKKFSGAAESATWNPEEKQMLFSFTGVGTETFTANPPEEGAEIRLLGESVAVFDSSYPASGRIVVTGEAKTHWVPSIIGSGSLKKFNGLAESLTVNPEEKQMLFSFTGVGAESTAVKPPEGDGRLFSFSGLSESVSVSGSLFGGLFRIDGESSVLATLSWTGSGSFKKFSGAAESITWNPEERQMLFDFIGTGDTSKSVGHIGSGRISIYPEAADYRFLPNWNGSGTIRVEVQSTYKFAPVWIGSGSFKKFNGAAESLTVNPEEKQMLFSFTGTGSESTVVNPPEEGTEILLSGEVKTYFLPNNIGSGTIRVTGESTNHYIPDYEGSGGLWSWAGASESYTISPAGLFTLLRISGDSPTSRSVIHIGSGSLKKFSGAAESITFNPDEKQMLFSFRGQGTTTKTRSESGQGTVRTLGDAVARFSPVYIGSGTARVSGEATVTRARDFVGFGSLKKFSGAAESLTWNPEEKQMLFSFTGVGADSKTSKLLSQSGVLTVRGTSGDPKLTFAEQPTVEIDITGDSVDIRSHAYAGSGRITNVNNVDESFTRDTYEGSGRIGPLGGFALVQIIVWQPAHTQVWII